MGGHEAVIPAATGRVRRGAPGALVASAVLAVLAGACGGGGDGGGGLRLVARDFAFEPATVELAGGGQATVEVVNRGGTTHNVTVVGTEIDLDLRAGERLNLIFVPEGDRLAFRCKYHPDRMNGTFVVTR